MAMSDFTGQRSGKGAALTFWREAKLRREAAKIAPFIDARFYLENNADVAASGIEASLHYAKYGWREGRDPSPSFSTHGYLSTHPAVALTGTNPLLHFIQQGDTVPVPEPPEDTLDLAEEIAIVAEHLDTRFYAASYPSATARAMTPAEHFCRIGWREGNDPAPDFSTSYYLLTNPDIKDSGINPFWHYLIAGRDEGRLPTHPGGWQHGVLSRQTTFEAYCNDWVLPEPLPKLLSADELVDRLRDGQRADRFLVSFGHDDYRATPGGVQLCIEIEERNAFAEGVDYLNLHPWQPLPKFAEADDDPVLRAVLNGANVGTARASAFVAALPEVAAPVDLVIHHLAGHAPETIIELADALGAHRAHLWLHDYFTLCTSYALQRNNVVPCNVPDIGSNACHICIFGLERQKQQARVAELFERLEIDVISPSRVALEFWEARTALQPASTVIHPHMTLSETTRLSATTESVEGPVRIAFIGTPVAHKGWQIFRELQRRLAAEEDYELWYFGTSDPGLDDIHHVETHVRADAPDSTLQAVSDHRIDLVLHWAAWPETFSFSTFEALGGGAFVLTNTGSGNVAAAVEDLGRGAVLGSADALFELAKSGGLKTLAACARDARKAQDLVATFSGMTHDLSSMEVLR